MVDHFGSAGIVHLPQTAVMKDHLSTHLIRVDSVTAVNTPVFPEGFCFEEVDHCQMLENFKRMVLQGRGAQDLNRNFPCLHCTLLCKPSTLALLILFACKAEYMQGRFWWQYVEPYTTRSSLLLFNDF